MSDTCGVYERTRPDGKVIRMVYRDANPLPRWTRVGDASCTEQFDLHGVRHDLSAAKAPGKKTASAIDWAKAEKSLMVQGPVSLAVLNERMSLCMECPSRRKDPSGNSPGWCDSCGCGARERARLDVKLTMPDIVCPQGKWGASKGSWGSIRRRFAGTAVQVRHVAAACFAELARFVRPSAVRLNAGAKRA